MAMMLTIQRIRDGGYIVAGMNLNPNRMTDFMFASTSIEDALVYIKSKMEESDRPMTAEHAEELTRRAT
jgi:hypothetical protein